MNATINKDFADWFSPMLVKEMRQGMRARVFVSAFLLMQGLMIFCVVMSLATQTDGAFDSSTGFFWTMVGFPLLLMMPVRGFGALSGEMKDNTLELIFLTRLTSWRIVAGKWSAIMAQTLLLACSVLPYMLLRYFLGGVNLLDDLQALCWMILVSAIFTAVAIAVSPFQRSWLAKVLLSGAPIAVIWLGAIFIQTVIVPRSRSGGLVILEECLVVAVLGPLFLLLMFEMAIARIAPPAENHSFRKRILSFCILAALGVLKHFQVEPEFLRGIGLILLLPVCVTSICEEIKLIPSVYLPFVKRGFPGRLAGMLFYPGWPSGLVFTMTMLVTFCMLFYGPHFLLNPDNYLIEISFLGGLLFPLALERMIFSKFNKTFVIYLSLQVFMLVFLALSAPLKDSDFAKWMKLAAPLPATVFSLKLLDRIIPAQEPFFLIASLFTLAVSVVLLLTKLPAQWKLIRSLEKEAGASFIKRKESEPVHASAA